MKTESRKRAEGGMPLALDRLRRSSPYPANCFDRPQRRGASSRSVGTGLVLGAIVAAVASRWVAHMLYETSPRDPVVYVGAALVLALAALVASIVPARRATVIDPARAIRAD